MQIVIMNNGKQVNPEDLNPDDTQILCSLLNQLLEKLDDRVQAERVARELTDLGIVRKLTNLATNNGWTPEGLRELFEIPGDRVQSRTLEGMIRQAIEEGDDPEWIGDMVSEPPE
jgi:hypothetical protein